MADTVDAIHKAAFWLPTHFLTDDDFLDHHPRTLNKDPKTFDLFSGGFDPFFGPPSALDSPVSSSEIEPEPQRGHHDDDFLAELTRHLAHSTLRDNSNPTQNTSEKPWLFSTSPQSTLTGFGAWSNRSGLSSNGSPNCPSQVPSPPVTPPGAKNNAAWELLYEAAGQVARLKMNAIAAAQMNHNQRNRGLVGGPRNPSMPSKSDNTNSFYDFPQPNQFQTVKRQSSGSWGQEREEWYCQHHHPRRSSSGAGALGLPQSAWPALGGAAQPHHLHHQQSDGPPRVRNVFPGGSGLGSGAGPVMKKSAGTGVFIPRRPGTEPPAEPRRKPTGGSPVLLPARVVHALNLDIEELNNGVNLNSQPRFGCGYVTDHELLMARRNSVVGEQRSLRRTDVAALMGGQGYEVCLPNDWTY